MLTIVLINVDMTFAVKFYHSEVSVTNISSRPMYETRAAYIERCCLLVCKRNTADLHNPDKTTALTQ